jgi:hypothetical protein
MLSWYPISPLHCMLPMHPPSNVNIKISPRGSPLYFKSKCHSHVAPFKFNIKIPIIPLKAIAELLCLQQNPLPNALPSSLPNALPSQRFTSARNTSGHSSGILRAVISRTVTPKILCPLLCGFKRGIFIAISRVLSKFIAPYSHLL